jgi:1,5-anhydro-D-fructose reductase (1,5-anhydro-D-mannitol-forming)
LSDKIGVAKLSFAHVHANGYADAIQASPDAELVVIWDEEPARGKEQAEKRGVPFEADLAKVLANPKVDAVACDAASNLHAELMIAAAEAGKHIFTEKVMTITIADADRVAAAVKKAGVKFMISLPSRANPSIIFAKKVVEEGLLGDITLMRARIAHSAALGKWFKPGNGHTGSMWFGDEEKAGGGALFDLGCHRVDVMRWILGEPETVVARMNNFSGAYPIDDNMVAVVEFKNKALGILDCSWVHAAGPNPFEIYGTKGYLTMEMGPGAPLLCQSLTINAGELQGPVAVNNLPKAPLSPMPQWFAAIKSGAETTITLQDGWNLTQMMEGIYGAARTGEAYRF